ncbi:MAG: UDP-N-acetylglucosamine 2-epimerase [Crocinitomicaceae bacterium]|nr:UDP-N-acetylglucosamine 2-epimerase [Crocinitomicaceae bacterium]
MEVFFEQFNLMPDYYLNNDGITPLQQMSLILIRLEHLIQTEFKPDLIITPGDVNSTLAVALVANKLNIKLAHLESGLRSFDRGMAEEINRILTDEVSDHYFVTEKSGIKHLQDENKNGQIHFVGNTMIDTLWRLNLRLINAYFGNFKICGEFVLITMQRPANVDFES